ncbi:MAG: ATPase [Prevotella sp.]|nr:ATPase [Prevotella sp.]
MRLIADSGSTKTDWVLTIEKGVERRFHTQGINPFHQSEESILTILREELVTQLPALDAEELSIAFYGSGVRPELEPVMERLLRTALPTATAVEAHSDLLGAARAVCGHREGIACILGTGANSCLYDGLRIVSNTPPLGYILGDEGSGAVLGIRFLNALYKGFLPATVVNDFQEDMKLSMADVIERVYRQPMANRFLASLAPFVKSHADVPQVKELVVDNFRCFLRRNVAAYGRKDLPVGFVGSIAFHFSSELKEAIGAEGMSIGPIIKSPLDVVLNNH